ncbi:B12-binding domain-containing protein [Mycobacterium sp. ELW1]|uniref:B12-binding domain-containing protein n=1 Tax=Mycobacterium sp. ELW1 TaxID=1547487 RepID=UPI0011ED2FA9|nr:B12-binding domain-containing protein [Mycobacterium sp. ELW1]QEN15121.1 hypothetical protein D3H54_19250 [Mycobacterium sp. ELW1]
MRELTPLEDYQQALASRNRARATGVITELLSDGVDPVTVLTDVIAASQREVGMRWQRAEWTVADEHAATAISVAATGAVDEYVSGIPLGGREQPTRLATRPTADRAQLRAGHVVRPTGCAPAAGQPIVTRFACRRNPRGAGRFWWPAPSGNSMNCPP